MSDYPTAVISTTLGDITIELWNDVAPNHAKNFLKLATDGFYDNLIFHRIIPDFVIQGGCPRGDGTGGPGYELKAEFNERSHDKGVLSMARSTDPDSAGSQFFICLGRPNCRHLDGQYTAFGKVTAGLDVVDKIAASELAPGSDRPADPPAMQSVRPV
jgi:peptidyl-prolyl cis-trans isomerase B (cyclophilin B)